MEEVAPLTLEGMQCRARKTAESPPRVAVHDVIAMVKTCDQNYAGQVYMRLLTAGKVPECAEVGQDLVHALGSCSGGAQASSQWGGDRKPVRVATASEMVQILTQLPGSHEFKKNCGEVIVKFLGGECGLLEDVATKPDASEDPKNATRLCWEEARGLPPSLMDLLAGAVETGIKQGIKEGIKVAQAAQAERLQALEEQLRKVQEYGPRIEMSRAFPSRPDSLLEFGIKLQEETDLQRLREYGLPVTHFLREKFPEKKISRISACFSKTLKQRRLELYREDPEEHRIFLLYHQGEWRIAYFEDDRELMEEVLQAPAMQETIKRHLEDVPTEGERNKRRQTLLTAYAAPPAYDVDGASTT